ncbi:Mg-dependent deoxyribonuclease [Actinobacillus indolicus]|nr:Mg-dependent deoxyribonuclease [Actinobacillus indolicus]VTU06789.1 Mg-dependent deoxyribonuclease [Actinobacillus indolicus]
MLMFDSHIHLDQYSEPQIRHIIQNPKLVGVLAVATDLASSQRLLALKQQFQHIHIAAGFHPEQLLPSSTEQKQLFEWIAKNHQDLTACGEVGLPHYLKREQPNLDYQPYIVLLEQFILLCKRYDLPINLHIVYDDTEIALELLAKHHIQKAHFHWFKASDKWLNELLKTSYFVSVNPDVLTNPKVQRVVESFPLERIMVETDGPWQHQHFLPIHITEQLSATIQKIASLKQMSYDFVSRQIYLNSISFYSIK